MPYRAMFSATLMSAGVALASQPSELKRFPDLSRDAIVFVHAGDLHVVPRTGGESRRLTSAPGQELFPKFSPDGQRIAFSAEYNGTRQVYVMPTDGSEAPRQLTWYNDVGPMPPRGGFDYRVLDWTPDGKRILFRANRTPQDERGGRPFLIDADGGMEEALAVPETGGGMLSPDGRYYVYTPIDREFRTWKRYRGGRAQDIWIYDLQQNDSRRLTDFAGTDNQPAWVGDTIYFTSDRGWLLNLWAIPPAGGEPRQVTRFTDYDVLFPSGGPDGVVFEKGGEIWLYAADAEARQVPIRIAGDRPETLPVVKNVAEQIQAMALSHKGERALVAARGEIFSVPAKVGEIRNLTRSSAREIDVSLSPDGKQMVYLSDATGEYEIWVASTDGRGSPRQVTRDGSIWRFAPVYAPDGKSFAIADKNNRLQIIDAETGDATTVDTATVGAEITRYGFSPDSRWLAYVKDDDRGLSRVWLHELGSNRTQPVTSGMYAAGEPAFDPKGRWLYFVSARDYNLSFSAYEFNYLYNNAQRIYAVSLSAQGPVLGRPRSDEIGEAAASLPAGWDGQSKIQVDLAGMEDRAVVLRPAAGNYSALSATDNGLVYLSGNAQQAGQSLRYFDLLAEREDVVLAAGGAYALSGDGSRALVRQQAQLSVVELKAAQDFGAGALKLERLEIRIDPPAEWQQIYVDAWRILRDWFYDEGLHGTDWPAVRKKYQPLVDAAVSRDDIDWVLGELAGELNAGHVYHERGDSPAVPRRPSGLLGAEIEATAGGNFRVANLFPGESWSPVYRNPLREPGVNVNVGDLILAVDGVDARGVRNFYQLLEGKANRVVRLRVSAADGTAVREVDVRTVASEQTLRYLDWVESRRAYVDRLSGGRVGYVHLPNTAIDGNRELTRQLYPQIRKDALIIDDRYNGGGFIPDRMIEVLARKRLNYWKRRGLDPEATPLISHVGPKAMLVNGLSSSGGDALPYYFRKLGLGPVIGTRTWGGLIGISGNPGLVDGGNVLAATFRILSTEGDWVVENEGVTPDIEVIDAPHLLATGRDPSVEKAVEVLLEALKTNPPRPVVAPPAPTRFGEAE